MSFTKISDLEIKKTETKVEETIYNLDVLKDRKAFILRQIEDKQKELLEVDTLLNEFNRLSK